MRTAAKIDLTNGMVTLDDGSKKTIDNYILELEDRFIELPEVLLKQNQEIDQLKAREKEHQRLNGELREEIERLNNIINEAKIYCEDVIQEHENGDYDVDTTWLAIKEHKGNIKSVLNILNGDLENYWRSDKE